MDKFAPDALQRERTTKEIIEMRAGASRQCKLSPIIDPDGEQSCSAALAPFTGSFFLYRLDSELIKP
jgi:hypothetical protein